MLAAKPTLYYNVSLVKNTANIFGKALSQVGVLLLLSPAIKLFQCYNKRARSAALGCKNALHAQIISG